ncbi:MAG: hypothetical protein AB1742_14365 [bacterium]
MMKKLTLASTASFIIAKAVAFADVPLLMSCEGRVTDTNGVPIADGSCNMTFGLFATDTAGVEAWTETQSGVPVENGLFSVNIVSTFGDNFAKRNVGEKNENARQTDF